MSLKEFIIGAWFSLLLAGLGACAPMLPSNHPPTIIPAAATAFATPTEHATVDPAEPTQTPASATPTQPASADPAESTQTPASAGTAAFYLRAGCHLLDSHDMGVILTGAEVVQSPSPPSQVDRPAFSSETAPATESICTYHAYHEPGSKNMQWLQTTYWLDIPKQTAGQTWASIWADAKSSAARVIPGVGDDAFFGGGRLTFKRRDIYITIEVVNLTPDTIIDFSMNRQLEMETRLASKVLGRLG